MALNYPPLNPVIIELGPLVIRWYSLAYIAGIMLGYIYIKHLNKKANIFSKDSLEDIVPYAALGIVIGGRLGFVLFYHSDYYFTHPLDILKIWQGGMSFHGGLIGMVGAIYLLSRRYKLAFWSCMDLMALAAPIGLFFGRIANFINDELWGRVTDVKWAVKFPHGGYLPRHPSQIYEALGEGVILFFLLYFIAIKRNQISYSGRTSALFLFFYGLVRLIIENWREPDGHLGLFFNLLSMGQILSLIMISFAIILFKWPQKR